MKKLLLSILLIPIIGISQENNLNANTFEQGGEESFIRINYKTENKGTPYLYENWREGYIVISDSIISHQDAIQLNLMNSELIIGAGKNKETGVVITDKKVTGFAITKDLKSTQKLFFAKISSSKFEDRNRNTKFYEVVSNIENNNYLIKEESKYLFDPNKSRGYQTQNSIPQEYKKRTSYYIKNKSGKYVKTRLSKKSILKALNDKTPQLKSFVSSKKIKFNNEQDVARVLNFYHSL